MPQESAIIDFDHAEQRKMFNGWVRSLHGPHKVKITKCRPTRTLPQNAWYWGCVLPAVAAGLEEAWGERLTAEDTHEYLKAKFNYRTIVNRETGEVLGKVPCSTATLNTADFGEYLDEIIQFAAEFLKVEIPQPCSAAGR